MVLALKKGSLRVYFEKIFDYDNCTYSYSLTVFIIFLMLLKINKFKCKLLLILITYNYGKINILKGKRKNSITWVNI